MHRRTLLATSTLIFVPPAFAHHGWSSFDQNRPIYVEGKVIKVEWRNPHAELDIELPATLKLPPDLPRRALPAQTAPVDGPGLLARAVLPTRRDKVWEIELAPLTRLEAWKVPEVKVGETVAVLGFTLTDEKGDAVVRAEFLFAGGKTYGMRSSPA